MIFCGYGFISMAERLADLRKGGYLRPDHTVNREKAMELTVFGEPQYPASHEYWRIFDRAEAQWKAIERESWLGFAKRIHIAPRIHL